MSNKERKHVKVYLNVRELNKLLEEGEVIITRTDGYEICARLCHPIKAGTLKIKQKGSN